MSAPSSRLTNPRIPRINSPKPEAVAASEPPPVPEVNGHELEAQEIARLAYSYWEARGCKAGSAEEDWLRAEQELRGAIKGGKEAS
jgi:predicted chitinase